jgi:glycine dehydrogenase subunit 1
MHYLPLTPQDEQEILKKLGVSSFQELLDAIIPKELQYHQKLQIPPAVSEHEIRTILKQLAGKNLTSADHISFLGAGIYDHYIPSIIDTLISRSEFYTAYTP